jgi:hypothetical protein
LYFQFEHHQRSSGQVNPRPVSTDATRRWIAYSNALAAWARSPLQWIAYSNALLLCVLAEPVEASRAGSAAAMEGEGKTRDAANAWDAAGDPAGDWAAGGGVAALRRSALVVR